MEMRYWLIYTNEVTNFSVIESPKKPKIMELTKTELINKKEWLKKHSPNHEPIEG